MASYATIILDIDPPVISSISPEDGSQDVGVNTPLAFTLSDVLAGVNIASLNLTIAGEQAIADGAFQSGYVGEINQNGGIYSISVTKDDNWPGLTNVIYDIRIQDTVGNELAFQGSFYTTSNYTESTGEWVNLGEDGTVLKGQLRRFLKLISFALDEAKGLIKAFPVILNVDKTDADYLPLIAALVGIDFNYDIPIPRQREEIKRAVEVYKAKGTIPGIKTFGRAISGLSVAIQEWPRNILISNDPGRLSAQVSTPETIEKTGYPGDQCMYSLDFSDSGDYRFDKFGIYFYLLEKAGLLKSVGEKLLRLLAKYIPASTLGKLIFIDHTYQLAVSGQLPTNIYHAFGTGEESWDDQLVQPEPGQTKLVNEIYRRMPDSIVYLDEDGHVTLTPTSRIRVTTILGNSELELDGCYLREQGLFGSASGEKDSGILFGVANNKGQWKNEGYRIRKTMGITFQ